MVVGEIGELDGLGYLEQLAQEYQSKYGVGPFDLSHWDPSDLTIQSLLKYLKLPASPSPIPYIYSDPGRKPRILERLGFISRNQTCSFVQSGTNATVLAAWWLRSLGIKRVLVLCPAYFSVFYAFEMVGITDRRLYLHRENGNWRFPTEEVLVELKDNPDLTAVWVTNPTYCTGSYCSEADVAFLDSLLRLGAAVVTDECLCLNGREIGRRLAWSDRFLGVYSPHKSVSINAVKFAAIVATAQHEKFFDRWSDVVVGNLTASNYSAISHFCDGQNFSDFLAAFVNHIDSVRRTVIQIVNNAPGLETDSNSIGHYISCYASDVPASRGRDSVFLRELVWETGAVVTPGTTNHFPPQVGFSFRINLARACPQFFSALHRTIGFLEMIGQDSV